MFCAINKNKNKKEYTNYLLLLTMLLTLLEFQDQLGSNLISHDSCHHQLTKVEQSSPSCDQCNQAKEKKINIKTLLEITKVIVIS